MRLIDADRLQKQFNEKSTNPNYRVNMHNIKSIINNAPTVEAIPKAEYEVRLKADLEAILVELQLEIDELRIHMAKYITSDGKVCIDSQTVVDVIQEKINALRGSENES